MLVLPVDSALALDKMPKHEAIRSELVEWRAGMGAVTFLSHTWLGFSSPDPHGVKWSLIKAILRKALDGMLPIDVHYLLHVTYGAAHHASMTAKQVQRAFTDGYIWIDCAAGKHGPGKIQRAPLLHLDGPALGSRVHRVHCSE